MKKKKLYKKSFSKKKALKVLKSFTLPDGSRRESSIEKKIRIFLERENIPFIQEYPICRNNKLRYYDFLITNGQVSFAIEVHGKYWHCLDYLEGKKPYNKLTKTQKKNLRNDKFKTNMVKKLGIPLLILWEDDINYKFVKTTKKIIDMCREMKINY